MTGFGQSSVKGGRDRIRISQIERDWMQFCRWLNARGIPRRSPHFIASRRKHLGNSEANSRTGASEEYLFHRSIVKSPLMRGQSLVL